MDGRMDDGGRKEGRGNDSREGGLVFWKMKRKESE